MSPTPSPTTDVFLRDVLDIPAPDDVHAGDFKVELSGGFNETAARVDEYVVTDQLRTAFQQALSLVRAAVRDNVSHAAYLHGSFGSGKSHFMTVLHAVLNRHPATLAKPRLREIIADHDSWLRARRFLMVPYHLVGATDLDSALLGGYVAAVRRQHPDAPTPAVYRSDALLDDARANRAVEGDELFIRKLAHSSGPAPDDDDLAPLDDDLAPLDEPATGWTGELLDRAFAAPHGDPLRERLVSALLSGPMKSYARGASGDADAFLPLDDGLAVMSRHAQQLGYDGIVLFIDELILWLQSHMSDQDFVKREVNKLVKIIESGNADRPVPIVSFISRQRNLSQLVGEDVTGLEVKNLEAQVEYLAERFDVINLEDRNLPAIIKERVLKPRPGAAEIIDAAFTGVERASVEVRDALLDAQGVTGADWDDFRAVYPLTPALLNVLVALSGALQRERTGLKLIQDLLGRRRDDLKIGQVIPLGDLWDVLAAGMGGAFTERLKKEGEQAVRFYHRVEAHLRKKYGADNPHYAGVLRLVKTLLLAYLAPDVPAFARLTGRRLAALNHGSVKRTRTLDDARLATRHLRELQAEFGELRADGDEDPMFSLHLSDLDVEPLLDQVAEQDRPGARRRWVRDTLWQKLGVTDTGEFVCRREVVWRGSQRTAEFVFGNVRDSQDLPDQEFEPSVAGHVRFVLDYPFDKPGHYPSDDAQRVHRLRQDERNHHPTVVWLPVHMSPQRAAQLGRLIRINHLLERDRLDDYAAHLSTDDRIRLRNQLKAQQDSLKTQLTTVLAQLYGIARLDEANTSTPLPEDGHVMSLLPDHRPRLAGGGGFETALYGLVDDLFDHLYPQHPDFDPRVTRKAVDVRDLRAVHSWISRAMEDGSQRVTVDRGQLPLVKRIVHPLELGEVHDGPLVLSTEWRRRIDQIAHQKNAGRDLSVAQLRAWIEELGWTGLDTPVQDLIIATYALLSDRAWVHPYRGVAATPPEIGRIDPGYLLRQQELPDEADFTTALNRAGALFGVGGVPPVLFARNVARLAAAVRERARAVEADVNGVYSLLTREQHAAVLGLTGAFDSPRPLAARHAVDLVERVLRQNDDTPLVRELAAVAYDVDDQTLGRAVASAGQVKRALETTDWQLLGQVHSLAGRDDSVGDDARKTVESLVGTARGFALSDNLADALASAQRKGRDLVARALQLATPTPSVVPQPPVVPPEKVVTDPEQVSLTEHGDPPVPSTAVRSGATRRIPARSVPSTLEQQMGDLLREIRAYAKQHPNAEIQVTWRGVDPTDGEEA